MNRRIATSILAVAGFGVLAHLSASPALGFFSQLRPWYGNQRPSGGGRDDGDRAAAREAAQEEADDRQYDGYVNQEDQAIKNRDWQEALRLAQQRQGMRDGPKVQSSIALYRGLIAHQSGDYRSAIAFWRQAADNPTYADWANENIKNLEKSIAEQEKRDRATAAVRDLNIVARQDTAPAKVEGLELAATPGAFGSKEVQPVLQPAEPAAEKKGDPYHDTGEQLKSASFHGGEARQEHSEEAAISDNRTVFDTPGENKGHVEAAVVETPESSTEMPVIPPEMANDPVIKEGVQHLTEWNRQLQKANEEVKKAETAVKQIQDPVAKALAVNTLNQAKSKSDGLQVAVASAKKQIVVRKIYLAPSTAGAPPAPQEKTAQPQPPAGTPAQ